MRAALVASGSDHPLMSEADFNGGYDVRGWGYAYGLQFLLEVKSPGAMPDGLSDAAEKAITFYADALQQTETVPHTHPPAHDTVLHPRIRPSLDKQH